MTLIASANLKYYLSGGVANTVPDASIGGARSTTLIGASLDNLFGDVTGDDAAAGETDYRCFYFRNEDANATGLMSPVVWIDTQAEVSDTISIGLDPAGKNGTAATPVDENTAPAGVSFTTPISKATGLALIGAPLVQNDFYPIWIRRITAIGAAAINPDTASVRVEGDTVP